MKILTLVIAMIAYTMPLGAIDTGLGEPQRLRAVMFSTLDCSPCRRMKAEIVRDLFPLGWDIEFIDASEPGAMKQYLEVSNGMIRVPQVVVIRGGQKLAAFHGYATPSQLAVWLNGCSSEKGSWK